MEVIEQIAKKHQLKVIYDGAHAFGVKVKGKSICEYGDISTCSFHSTKLFHTIEGGAVVTKDPELLKKMAFLRNFGHDGYEKFNGIGINGKYSEFHASMGLSILPHLPEILRKRKAQCETYLQVLTVSFPFIGDIEAYNFAYFPIIFASESALLQSKEVLETHGIFPRRYFYPGLNTLDYTSGYCPISDDIAKRIVCLPIYFKLSKEEQKMIVRLLLRVQNN